MEQKNIQVKPTSKSKSRKIKESALPNITFILKLLSENGIIFVLMGLLLR